MNKVLSAEQVAAFGRDGFVSPLTVLDADETDALRRAYESRSALIKGRNNQKPHLLFPFLDELIRHPRILDPIEDLFGHDLLCWSAQFFDKPAGDPGYVSWHQDATYWGLSSPDVVTAWVALSPSTPVSGCMQVVPGTHHEQVRHEDRFDQNNLLSRGQEIMVDVDRSAIVDVVLSPGQMSLHHVLLFHGSQPNTSNEPRIGFAIRYIPTHVHQVGGPRESATLVRGADHFGHFDHEVAPVADMDESAVAQHGAIIDRQLRRLYEGANRGRLNPLAGRPAA